MKTSTICLVALAGYVLFSGGTAGGGAQTQPALATKKKLPKQVKLTAAQKKSVKTKRRAM